MNGSPLASGSAVATVFAAALANGGSLDDVGPGIDFFRKVEGRRKLHSRVPATPQTIASGQTPISNRVKNTWNLADGKAFPPANWRTDRDPIRRRLRCVSIFRP